jgi:hypothetical protein
MPTFGIFARDPIDLAKRAYLLRTATLIGLLTAWPLAPSAGAPVVASQERSATVPAVAPNASAAANDPLWRWFKEQDRLLDDILTRLARIEGLVGDIHRLVSRMPDQTFTTQPIPSPAPSPATSPVTAPTVPTTQVPAHPKPTRPPLPDFDEEEEKETDLVSTWSVPLAGGALLLLLLLLWARKRSAAASRPAQNVHRKTTEAAAIAPATVAPTLTSVDPTNAVPTPAAMAELSSASQDDLEPVSEQADQALELAEIMLSMGLGHGAAQTLAEQIRNEPKQALRHWLRLLEIYRKNGQQEEFERSAEELRQHFNVKPEDWLVQPDAPRSLEDYPHIANRLTELWGRPACLVYLHNLLADNRGGSRSGFPQSVAEELLLLTAMLRDGGIVS